MKKITQDDGQANLELTPSGKAASGSNEWNYAGHESDTI